MSTPFFGRLSIQLAAKSAKPPHLFTKMHAHTRQWQKSAALFPLLAAACVAQGWPAVTAVCAAISGALIAEAIGAALFRRKIAYHDGESLFFGIFCAMILPFTLSPWIFFAAAFIAIFWGREVFGGFGQALIFPPALGVLILFMALPSMIQAFDFKYARSWSEGVLLTASGKRDLWSFFYYPLSAAAEDASFMALAAGVLILIASRLVAWELPIFYAASCGLVYLLIGKNAAWCSGGFWLVLFWGLTQTSSMPLKAGLRRWYAVLAGILGAVCPLGDPALNGLAGFALTSLVSPWLEIFANFRRGSQGAAV